MPRWISATPFRHPVFLLLLSLPALADALHAYLTITREPFRGAFDDFLHDILGWSLLISPVLVWCGWRKLLFVLVRRLRFRAKAAWTLAALLIPFLLVQFWWFHVGITPQEGHGFSPTLPRFLAGPAIGLAMGLIHVQQVRCRSLLGFLALTVSLGWVLIPPAMEMAMWTSPHWGGGSNWFTTIPFLGSTPDGLIIGLTIAKGAITDGLGTAYVYLPVLLLVAGIEIRVARLPWRSSLVTLAGILVFLPFFHEWENFWWD